MTFLVALSLEKRAILAADRETFAIAGEISIPTGVLEKKITRTRYGGVTANGFVELIDPVKRRLASENAATVGDMLDIIEEEQGRFVSRHEGCNEALGWVAKTSWKITLPLNNGVVAACYSYGERGFYALSPGRASFAYPVEVEANDRKHVEMIVSSAMSKGPVEGVIHAIISAARYLKEGGRPISHELDFLVHDIAGTVEFTAEDFGAMNT